MTRIAPARRPGPLVRLIFRATEREFGRLLEPIAVQARVPRLLFGYGAFEFAAARSRHVPERLKKLAEVKAATACGCQFCVDIGTHIAGLSPEELLALSGEHRASTLFNEREQLVMDYAEAMSTTPVRVDDQLWRLMQSEFDEPAIVELTTMIALENYRARFNWALEIPPAGFSPACAAPAR